jgi:hypothetical protein
MTIADYAELKILDAVFNNTSFVVAQPYVKLHIADPGETGASGAAAEVTRKALSVGTAAAGACVSDADLTWTNVAGTETISHISIWDASTAGNCLWSGALAAPKAVTTGDTFTIPSGQLTISLD